MSKLFQIREEDLCTLEHDVPELLDAMYSHLDNRLRTQVRRIQQVIVNVRWNYGPPTHVETDGDGGDA